VEKLAAGEDKGCLGGLLESTKFNHEAIQEKVADNSQIICSLHGINTNTFKIPHDQTPN
jgi:hypothetical protein